MPLSDALCWRRPNAGIMKATLKHEGRKHVQEVVKVKAHVNEHDLVDPVAKRHAKGNSLADEAAALGRECHPVWARGDTSAEAYARKIHAIALTIAHTCKLWPRSKVTNGTLKRIRGASAGASPRSQVSGPIAGAVHKVVHSSHYLRYTGQLCFSGLCGTRAVRCLSKPCPRRPRKTCAIKQREALMRDSRAGADCVATPSLRSDQVIIGGVLSEDGV